MRMRRSLLLVVCLTLLPSLTYAAASYYLKIEGVNQGALKGQINRKGSLWIPVLGVSQGVQSPRDVATGQASGKRQHKPIVIRKEVDAASPQLYRAAISHEALKEVLIDFVRTDPRGKEEVYQTITLRGAHIADIKKIGNRAAGDRPKEEEEISITYEEIQVTDKMGKTTATDDWQLSK
jgi:type VI secretion system secreted protein Hcp